MRVVLGLLLLLCIPLGGSELQRMNQLFYRTVMISPHILVENPISLAILFSGSSHKGEVSEALLTNFRGISLNFPEEEIRGVGIDPFEFLFFCLDKLEACSPNHFLIVDDLRLARLLRNRGYSAFVVGLCGETEGVDFVYENSVDLLPLVEAIRERIRFY